MKAAFSAVAVCLLVAQAAFGQAARPGTLQVTVVDPSGGVLPTATVTVSGAEAATNAVTPAPSQASDVGVATITGLLPGRYTVEASFPGFETRVLKDVRVRSGDNKQVMVLAIEKLESSVTVSQGDQEAASDRAGRFGTTLTREQIDALSDDPDTLRQQLQDMAGPGVVIKVDSFEGGALPAKAQIRSIRISRDQFAAENHAAGGVSVEVITQPGVGPVRYNMNFRVRNGALSGRSPFTSTLGPEQNLNLNLNVGGTLIKDKSSFNLNVNGVDSYDTPILNLARASGTRSETLGVRTPRKNVGIFAQVDYAVTLNQTLRVNYFGGRFTNSNLGVGGFDEVERAYSTQNTNYNVRVQQFGPLGRRAFLRTRGQVGWSDSDTHSAIEALTIRVNDAFTSGGAQRAGGQHTRTLNVATDLDYVRGLHSLRGGILLDAGWYHSDDTTNYLGTYTFESLDAYTEGRPRSYTRRIGDPNIRYRNLQAGVYLQDDIRVSKNLTLSPGFRYEWQTHISDSNNIGPRFGVTWAPFANGVTTLRGSAGIFYDWLVTNTYEQTLRVDGFRQQELNIIDPLFPDPGDVGTVPPVNRYLLAHGLSAPKTSRLSAGIDQGLGRLVRVAATYSYMRGSALARGLNLNAPIDGVRPEPVFGNIIEVVSDASSRQHQLQIDSNINPGALLPAFGAPFISWKRATVFINYTLAQLKNNTDGAFSVPATGELSADWGPAANDVRQRLNLTFNNQIVRNLLLSFNINASSGNAYTIRTGTDDNGDLLFTDRPGGVGRNTQRAAAQWGINLTFGYQFAFGRLTAPLPPGIGVFGGGGAAQVRTFDPGNLRYRLQVFVSALNLTNHPNYVGYSGTMTSPFFGKPTSVLGTRKIDAGINFSF
jgi:hypothetical protein